MVQGFNKPGPQSPKGPSNKENARQTTFSDTVTRRMNSGTAICSIVYALPAGCIVHRPSYERHVLPADLVGASRALVRSA